MPDVIDDTGITVRSRAELIDQLQNGGDGYLGMYDIYGSDINLDTNAPDGNFIQLVAQLGVDIRELIVGVFNSRNADTASGLALDIIAAYNGVKRKGGTYTTQLVTVTVSQAVTLAGLDTAPTAPFTIADGSGNQYFLAATNAFGAAGNANLTFRAAKVGALEVTANTLTSLVSVVSGVVSVTNGTLAGTTGTAAESSYALRLRRDQSVELPSQGYADGLEGALLALPDVTDAKVFNNRTNAVDGNGVPAHGVWVIVAGGTAAEVGALMFLKINAGAAMRGGISVPISQQDGNIDTMQYDNPTPLNLWISFDIAAVSGVLPDNANIRTLLLENLSYRIAQPADASDITAILKTLYPNCSTSLAGVSLDNVTYAPLLATTLPNNQWALDATRISINGSLS